MRLTDATIQLPGAAGLPGLEADEIYRQVGPAYRDHPVDADDAINRGNPWQLTDLRHRRLREGRLGEEEVVDPGLGDHQLGTGVVEVRSR